MQFTGIDDFDAQLRGFLNTLINEIRDASETAIDDARDVLKKHITQDVYKAYSPTAYKRRSDDSAMGTPLSDMDAYSKIIKPAGGNVSGNLVVTSRLFYNPEGGHKVAKWSSKSAKKGKGVNNVDFNDLIGRIEKKSPAYNWGQDMVPPRPFWQNFVDDMVTNELLEKRFVEALKGSENVVADGNIVEDSFDREY